MNLSLSPELYDKSNSTKILANALQNGCLSLFIGAGVSKSASSAFATWDQLVENCCIEAKIEFDPNKREDNSYLRKRISDIENSLPQHDYLKLVTKCLYKGVNYNYDELTKSLLVAIGSIVMGSIRGSAGIVVNYNFDDLLEWYLSFHGFKCQVVSKIPSLITKSDVVVYHPHGFLPKSSKFEPFSTDSIIFSYKNYKDYCSFEVNPWNELQRSILSSKCNLFIGLSGDDEHIETLCNYAYGVKLLNSSRIIGFIVLPKNEISQQKIKDNLGCGLITVEIDNHDALPDFLLEICRNAAEL